MENQEKKTTKVEMTAEELEEFQEMKAFKAKKAAEQKRKEDRASLQELTDEGLINVKSMIKELKLTVQETRGKLIEQFQPLMDMRRSINQSKEKKEQDSFLFTNSEGTMRLRIGYNLLDNYLDGAEDGIALVKEYLNSLGKDDQSKELIDMVMQLLQKDMKGNLKASRVMQLDKIANESGNEKFIEGMRIIRENYRPIRSSRYIKFEVRDEEKNEWEKVDTGL